ncbi:MAG: hypothetical protein M3121_01390 [Chloroflexota bacterium]|nr:hypothetical protein [Chloroflexota bacterium]
MSHPDFVRLNGEPVRVTSLSRDGERISLVIILRGSGAHRHVRDLLGQRPLRLAIPDEPEREVVIEHAEHAVSGEGERALYRHSVRLIPAASTPPPQADGGDLTARLDRIERKLDRILAKLDTESVS